MPNPTVTALTFASALAALGLATATWQLIGLRRLAARKHVPSDEHGFLRNRHRRRLLTALLLVLAGGLIAGAYLSGMEDRADALAEPHDQPRDLAADKQFVRVWVVYWGGVILIAAALLALALSDAIAARRFWAIQYRQLRDDHEVKLRRDLAVHRQSKRGRGAARFDPES